MGVPSGGRSTPSLSLRFSSSLAPALSTLLRRRRDVLRPAVPSLSSVRGPPTTPVASCSSAVASACSTWRETAVRTHRSAASSSAASANTDASSLSLMARVQVTTRTPSSAEGPSEGVVAQPPKKEYRS